MRELGATWLWLEWPGLSDI